MTLNMYPWSQYYSFKQLAAIGVINLNGDTFKMALLTSSYTVDLTHTKYADVSGSELPTANGYTVGGFSLGQSFWFGSGSGSAFFLAGQTALVKWKASGGSLTARYAVIYDFTEAVTPKGLMAISALNTVNGVATDIVIPDGLSLVLTLQGNLVLT